MISVGNIDEHIIKISHNYTKIISKQVLFLYKETSWGNNGIGDRWLNKRYNYVIIYKNKKTRVYSENNDDNVEQTLIEQFYNDNVLFISAHRSSIIGIFVLSKRTTAHTRKIRLDIIDKITKKSCVVCGSNTNIECDHKNDLYNDERVLNITTQIIDDFQPLCRHCNQQKRQVCKMEKTTKRIHSAKTIPMFRKMSIDFPWEKIAFDQNDKYCKTESFWYDPVEFCNKIDKYLTIILPINIAIKNHFALL